MVIRHGHKSWSQVVVTSQCHKAWSYVKSIFLVAAIGIDIGLGICTGTRTGIYTGTDTGTGTS